MRLPYSNRCSYFDALHELLKPTGQLLFISGNRLFKNLNGRGFLSLDPSEQIRKTSLM